MASYQFYNRTGANTTSSLIPLLLEKIDTPAFKIVGIGQSSTGFSAGYNSVEFVLSGGAALIAGSSTWFGWADTTALGSPNTGTIAASYPSGGSPISYYHAPAGLTVGQQVLVLRPPP